MALPAGINLLGMALVALIAIQLAMRRIVRIIRFQVGSLLSKRLIAITVTRQARIVVNIIAIGQTQIVSIARQLTSKLSNLRVNVGFMAVKACCALVHAMPMGKARSIRIVGAIVIINMLAHGAMTYCAAKTRRIMPCETTDTSNNEHGNDNAHNNGPTFFADLFRLHRFDLSGFFHFISHLIHPLRGGLARNITKGHAASNRRAENMSRIVTREKAS